MINLYLADKIIEIVTHEGLYDLANDVCDPDTQVGSYHKQPGENCEVYSFFCIVGRDYYLD